MIVFKNDVNVYRESTESICDCQNVDEYQLKHSDTVTQKFIFKPILTQISFTYSCNLFTHT